MMIKFITGEKSTTRVKRLPKLTMSLYMAVIHLFKMYCSYLILGQDLNHANLALVLIMICQISVIVRKKSMH